MNAKTGAGSFTGEPKRIPLLNERRCVNTDRSREKIAIQSIAVETSRGFATLVEPPVASRSTSDPGTPNDTRARVSTNNAVRSNKQRASNGLTKPSSRRPDSIDRAGETELTESKSISDGSIPTEFLVSMLAPEFISSINQAAAAGATDGSSLSNNPGVKPAAFTSTANSDPIEINIKTAAHQAGSVEIRYRHPGLGPIRLEMAIDGNRLEIIASVNRRAAADVIRNSESVLCASLNRQGIELKSLKLQFRRTSKAASEKSRPRKHHRDGEGAQA